MFLLKGCFAGSKAEHSVDAPPESVPEKTPEQELDETLDDGYIGEIKKVLTPDRLAKVETNTLIKALEVSSELQKHAQLKGPDEGEFTKLANKVDNFSMALLDPLKFDGALRSAFDPSLDLVVEKAIDCEQKKVLSHPVIFNLLTLKWYGRFITFKKGKWIHVKYWEWLLLRFWTCFDVILFPIVFFFLFIYHMVIKQTRKTKGIDLKFVHVLRPSKEGKEQQLTILKAIHYVEERLVKTHPGNSKYIRDGSFDTALNNAKNDISGINKVLVVFTSDKKEVDSVVDTFESKPGMPQQSRIRVIPVALGLNTNLKKLEKVGYRTQVIHWCDYTSEEASKRLGKKIIQSIEGDDLFECYREYFTTPYFVFARDITSQLTLLGLHFYICLTPPQIPFSRVEWAILVFFIGRIETEARQFWASNRFVGNQVTKKDQSYYHQLRRYFSDRWNVLDCIIVCTYLFLFCLRVITWSVSTEVPFNRALAVSGYMYGLNAMFITLRLFGHWMETHKEMGAIEIALFRIMGFLTAIALQFFAVILAFSLVITKVYVTERSYANKETKFKGSWWETVKFLAWSLVGLADNDRVIHDDKVSTTFAEALYGMFLVLGGILLLNMMIAILSNTYERVEDNSNLEWTYKMAITIRTYESYHPVPIPLNLIFIALDYFRGCCYSRPTPAEQSHLLHEVTDKLNTIYRNKNGNKFPAADEDKHAILLRELKENQRMADQIALKVFHLSGMNQCNLPVGPQAWQSDRHFITINECQLTYNPQDRITYHGARHQSPLTKSFSRFEVLIQKIGKKRSLVVGVVWDNYDLHKLPGQEDETLGYHVGTGKIIPEQNAGEEKQRSAMAYRGDLIGCEVLFDTATEDSNVVPILFTLNGCEVARRNMPIRTNGNAQQGMFPFISMGHEWVQVLAKVCPPSARDCGQDTRF